MFSNSFFLNGGCNLQVAGCRLQSFANHFQCANSPRGSTEIASDVTGAMLVVRTMAEMSFGNLTLLLRKTKATSWPSYHVSAIKG